MKRKKRSEENYGSLLSQWACCTSEGLLVLDPDGRVAMANESFSTQSGYVEQDLLGRLGSDLLYSDVAGLPPSGSEKVSFTLHHADNRNLQMEGRIFEFEEEAQILTGICLQPKKAESAELDLLKLQNKALASTANGVVITDARGLIVWGNRSFTKISGYSLEEVQGKSPGELLKSGKHTPDFYTDMWETVARGEIWQGELINRRKDGSLYPEEMTITPLFASSGEITHYIAIKQDVSEKKMLQEMFLRAQRLESVGALAGGIAHDLNNVLSPIVMSADLMMMQCKDANTREMLQMIKDSGNRGAEIIRQLLTFLRGEDDDLSELQLRHLLREQVKVFREIFPRYIQIVDRITAGLHTVEGNATHLHQVFTNLMINARDAMANGGTLLVAADNVKLSEAQASSIPQARAGEFVRVRIEDDGSGIPKELQEDIFSSFFTTKAQGMGTGLGLPTVMTILEKHQGFLNLCSEVGKGTVFEVYLPVLRGEQATPPAPKKINPPRGKGEKILVVDDEDSIGFMLKSTLESLNYQVVFIDSGQQALNWWDQFGDSCDLIMLDMMMPGMDGAKVYAELKSRGCEAEILLMSGMVSEEKLAETGLDLSRAFLAKPFTIMRLARVIRILLKD